MKSLLVLLAVQGTLFLSFHANSTSLPIPLPEKEIAIGINDAFIPRGPTSNADISVMVNGIYPNGCYKWGRSSVTHLDSRLHEVRTFANVTQGMCIMVLIPFTHEIHFGPLEAGAQTLRFISGDGTYLEKKFVVGN